MKIATLAPALLAVLVLGAACRQKAPQPQQPPRPGILGQLPGAPGAYLVDTTGSADAERRTYSVPHPMDSVADFYRDKLHRFDWLLMSDRPDSAGGMVDLYATRGQATIWVHVQRNGATAAMVTLIGNAGQATPPAPPQPRPR